MLVTTREADLEHPLYLQEVDEDTLGQTARDLNYIRIFLPGDGWRVTSVAVLRELIHVLSDLKSGDDNSYPDARAMLLDQQSGDYLADSMVSESAEWQSAFEDYTSRIAANGIEHVIGPAGPYSLQDAEEFYAEVNTAFRGNSALQLSRIYLYAPQAWRLLVEEFEALGGDAPNPDEFLEIYMDIYLPHRSGE